MFVRKTRNRSGSVCVQIISKDSGKYQVVKTLGSSNDPVEVQRFVDAAQHEIKYPEGQNMLFAHYASPDAKVVKTFLEGLSNKNIQVVGPELIFGTLFDRIGFNVIESPLFRHLVIARLAFPLSKLKTTDYLYRYQGKTIGVDTVYRFLDRLQSKHKEEVENISYEHTKKRLGGAISVVFYDMTTLYFEASDEDDLRKIGFSKDGKFQKPQIMIGLLVGKDGLPIGYDIYKGNTFEGHTLIPFLKKMKERFNIKEPTVIADSALLSKKNLESLSEQKYSFILGGRIKNESDVMKARILKKAKNLKNGDTFSIKRPDNTRLIVSFSEKRRRKDAHNRKRGLTKLKERVKSGKLTKQSINNRGYNKFLILKNEVKVEINEEKIEADKAWDGLKGYITNTKLRPKTVISNYNHLWHIEKAFRISKSDLKIRPIYHRLEKRIEAHICIAFVAYTIWKELELLLKKHKVDMSAKRAGELTQNMYALTANLPGEAKSTSTILSLTDEQQLLYRVIHKKILRGPQTSR